LAAAIAIESVPFTGRVLPSVCRQAGPELRMALLHLVAELKRLDAEDATDVEEFLAGKH
jgi:hypothetical protein